MMKRFAYIIMVIFLIPVSLIAQEERVYNRKAIKAYKEKKYNEAIMNAQKAIEKAPDNHKLHENLGHAEFRNENYENAVEAYMKPSETGELSTSGQYYNLGNGLLQSGEYDKSIEAYKKALRADPGHYNSKYNMSLARTAKQNMQQQQQQKQGGEDQDKDQEEKDENKEQDQDKQDQKKDDGDKDQNKEQQQKNKEQQQNQEMSKKDAERLLKALEKREEDIQEDKKDKVKKAIQSQPDKDW